METNDGSVQNDPRWTTVSTQGFACSCGERHVGLFPINLHHPIGWQGGDDYAPDEDMTMDGDFLSANFWVVQGKQFAMCARLPFQIRGASPAAFMFTAWAGLDRNDFEAFYKAYRENNLKRDVRVRARLLNRVGGFPDSYNLHGSAYQEPEGGPPVMIVHGVQLGINNEHPLLLEQRNGIGVDRMLQLFAAYGHEMRVPVANSN